MGIQVGDNFDHKSKKPLDARTSYTTLALMKAVTDANINEGCEAYCAETDKYYMFKSTNTVDESTGKWREREGGGVTRGYVGQRASSLVMDFIRTVNEYIVGDKITVTDSSIFDGVTGSVYALVYADNEGSLIIANNDIDLEIEQLTTFSNPYANCNWRSHDGATHSNCYISSINGSREISSKYANTIPSGWTGWARLSDANFDAQIFITSTVHTHVRGYDYDATTNVVEVLSARRFYEDDEYTTEISPKLNALYEDIPTGYLYVWNGSDYEHVGGGGDSSLTDLTDTNISSPSAGQLLGYNETSNEWENVNAPSTNDCYKTGDSAETDIVDGDYFPFYDTSATAKKKSLWSNIKSVLKTYFDTVYQKKLVDGFTATINNNEVVVPSASFGTSEQIVGTWINGERLYQRTYTGTFPSSAGDVTLFNVSGLYVKDITGYCLWKSGDANFFKLPSSYNYNGNRSDCCFYVYNGNLVAGVTDGNNYIKGKSYVITIRYTK